MSFISKTMLNLVISIWWIHHASGHRCILGLVGICIKAVVESFVYLQLIDGTRFAKNVSYQPVRLFNFLLLFRRSRSSVFRTTDQPSPGHET